MNAKIKITYRDMNGDEILNPIDGQKAYSPETQKLYHWSAEANEWQLLDGDMNLGMTTYDLNKQIISQLPALDVDGIQKARTDITNFFDEIKQQYYMLLSRDINYYTVFRIMNILDDSINCILDEVWACAEYIGDIKSVSREEGAIEIWVQPKEENSEPIVMYLFGYDAGVIECIR